MTERHLVESSLYISKGTKNPQLNTRRNTAKIVVGLTVVFLISYVPYHDLLTYIIWTQGIDDAYSLIRVMILYLHYGIQNLILHFFFQLIPVSILQLCSVPVLRSDSISNAT
jgi:hypothetical protein